MKKFIPFTLVFVAPAFAFLGSYFGGRGFISREMGLLVSAVAMFLLPFLVSVLIVVLSAKSLLPRLLGFTVTLLIQFFLNFGFVPPGAQSEMMGIGHRFRNQFQANEIRSCAESILQKQQSGLIKTNPSPPRLFHPLIHANSYVADSELTANLQGKFRCIGIVTSDEGSRVIFEVEPQTGIIYGKKLEATSFFHYELAEDVYAYRYERL